MTKSQIPHVQWGRGRRLLICFAAFVSEFKMTIFQIPIGLCWRGLGEYVIRKGLLMHGYHLEIQFPGASFSIRWTLLIVIGINPRGIKILADAKNMMWKFWILFVFLNGVVCMNFMDHLVLKKKQTNNAPPNFNSKFLVDATLLSLFVITSHCVKHFCAWLVKGLCLKWFLPVVLRAALTIVLTNAQ